MSLREIVREFESLRDGQTERKTSVIRRVKLQTPQQRTVSHPKASAVAISAIFGVPIAPMVKNVTHRDKLTEIEIERYRWMTLGENGKLIPRGDHV